MKNDYYSLTGTRNKDLVDVLKKTLKSFGDLKKAGLTKAHTFNYYICCTARELVPKKDKDLSRAVEVLLDRYRPHKHTMFDKIVQGEHYLIGYAWWPDISELDPEEFDEVMDDKIMYLNILIGHLESVQQHQKQD